MQKVYVQCQWMQLKKKKSTVMAEVVTQNTVVTFQHRNNISSCIRISFLSNYYTGTHLNEKNGSRDSKRDI